MPEKGKEIECPLSLFRKGVCAGMEADVPGIMSGTCPKAGYETQHAHSKLSSQTRKSSATQPCPCLAPDFKQQEQEETIQELKALQ